MKSIRSLVSFITSVAVVLAVFATVVSTQSVYAASLNTLSDTLSSAAISTVANHTISFVTPTGVASGATIILTFPAGFSVPAGLTFTDIDVLDNGTNVTLAAAPSGATWGAVRTSSTVITLTNGTTAVTAGHTIVVKIGTNATNQSTGVNQITNSSSTGNQAITISGTFGDTGSITLNLVTNDTVNVSGTVAQSMTFSISTTTLSFGTLSSSNAQFATATSGSATDVVAHTLAVSTNGATGYTITVQGATLTSLQNASNTIAAIGASPAVSAPGTQQFGIYATQSGGVNSTIAAPYATLSSFGYNATATSSATFASGTSATPTNTLSLHYIANITPTTPAGTYPANIEYVATSNF